MFQRTLPYIRFFLNTSSIRSVGMVNVESARMMSETKDWFWRTMCRRDLSGNALDRYRKAMSFKNMYLSYADFEDFIRSKHFYLELHITDNMDLYEALWKEFKSEGAHARAQINYISRKHECDNQLEEFRIIFDMLRHAELIVSIKSKISSLEKGHSKRKRLDKKRIKNTKRYTNRSKALRHRGLIMDLNKCETWNERFEALKRHSHKERDILLKMEKRRDDARIKYQHLKNHTLKSIYAMTSKRIRSAYRKLGLMLHPDRAKNIDDTWDRVQNAYEVLKDEEKRREYNLADTHKAYLRMARRKKKQNEDRETEAMRRRT